MDFYDLLQRDLPFALSVHYNLLYAYSYPDSDMASQALGNLIVNLNLLHSAKAQIMKEFDQIKMQTYLKSTIFKETQRLNKPTNQELAKIDAFDYQSFINERQELNQKIANQKYQHVIKTMQCLFKILENFSEDRVREVFYKIKEQLERTRIDGDVLTHLKKHMKQPLQIGGKSSTLPGIRLGFSQVPHLMAIEYQEDEKIQAENEEEYMDLQRVKSSGRIDPFELGSVKSDNNHLALNIDTNQYNGPKSYFLESPTNPNLSPTQKASRNLEILRKSQVINSSIQKKQAKYNGLNIEIILDIMNYSMETCELIIKKLNHKRLQLDDLTKIKDNRTEIDLKMQRYYKRLQPKIKELIYKVWGFIDQQSNISKFIVQKEKIEENQQDQQEEQQQQEQAEEEDAEIIKDKEQESKEKEEETPVRPNGNSFKRADEEQILEEAKPQQDMPDEHSSHHQQKQPSDINNQNKPNIQISELDFIQPTNKQEENQHQKEESQENNQDQQITPRLRTSNDQIWDELQKSHYSQNKSDNSPERLLSNQNIFQAGQRLENNSPKFQESDNQAKSNKQDDPSQDSDYDPKEGHIIQLNNTRKSSGGSVQLAPPLQEPAFMEQEIIHHDAFDDYPDQIKPVDKKEDSVKEYDAFDDYPDQIKPVEKKEDSVKEYDAFDDYHDQIKPVDKKEDSMKEYDAFDDYHDQIKPVENREDSVKDLFGDQIVVGAGKFQNDAFEDAFDEPKSEIIFDAAKNDLSDGLMNAVPSGADAFQNDELQFKKNNDSDQEDGVSQFDIQMKQNAYNDDDDEEVKSQVISVSKNAFDGFRSSMIMEQGRILTTQGDDNYSQIAEEHPEGFLYPPFLEARIIQWKTEILNKTWAC